MRTEDPAGRRKHRASGAGGRTPAPRERSAAPAGSRGSIALSPMSDLAIVRVARNGDARRLQARDDAEACTWSQASPPTTSGRPTSTRSSRERWICFAPAGGFLRWRPPATGGGSSPGCVDDSIRCELAHIAVRDIRHATKSGAQRGAWTGAVRVSVTRAADHPECARAQPAGGARGPRGVDAIRAGILSTLGRDVALSSRSRSPERGASGAAALGRAGHIPRPAPAGAPGRLPDVLAGQPRNLGTKGEYAAPVMYRLRNEMVTVPMPGGAVKQVTLQAASTHGWTSWAQRRPSRSATPADWATTCGSHSQACRSTVDLTSVGVGVSQVVPVVLACLLPRPAAWSCWSSRSCTCTRRCSSAWRTSSSH